MRRSGRRGRRGAGHEAGRAVSEAFDKPIHAESADEYHDTYQLTAGCYWSDGSGADFQSDNLTNLTSRADAWIKAIIVLVQGLH